MVFCVRALYVVAILTWLIVCYYLRLHALSSVVIASLPIILFLVSMYSASSIDEEVAKDMFAANFLSVGLILALPLLTWSNQDYSGDRTQFASIVVIGMIFSLLALYDVWIPKRWYHLYLHLRTILQTFALTLIVIAFSEYFMSRGGSLPTK